MKKDALPPLTALRAFAAAGQLLSFRDAAQQLGVTPSAVSHQVRLLEEWLETPLFMRMARRIALTPAGKRFHRDVLASLNDIAVSASRLRASTKRTTLKISALPLITNVWLIPRLAAFEAKHPDITLAITTENRVADFDKEDVDVGIRNVRAPTPGLFARKLLDIRLVPLCARRLTTGAHALREAKDLAQHTLINVSARPGAWARWLEIMGVGGLKAKRELTFDTVPAALEAASRGHGVTLGMSPLVWESPSVASLVVPFASKVDADSAYYLVHRKADRSRPEVRAFVDWIAKEMAAFARTHRSIPIGARVES
ncbi:MAG: LysR substrate-binding domain-containing protein [Alphaproteobacteria bacterium]|jgi:LysR family glycine cleavage system transcriptional activator|nr:LysR substrate-binding domain-containing protein [Alphaproteobacteria bacterium]